MGLFPLGEAVCFLLWVPLHHSDHTLACDCVPWALQSLTEQPGLSLTFSPPVLTTFMPAGREHGTETIQLGNIWPRVPVDHSGQAGQKGPRLWWWAPSEMLAGYLVATQETRWAGEQSESGGTIFKGPPLVIHFLKSHFLKDPSL